MSTQNSTNFAITWFDFYFTWSGLVWWYITCHLTWLDLELRWITYTSNFTDGRSVRQPQDIHSLCSGEVVEIILVKSSLEQYSIKVPQWSPIMTRPSTRASKRKSSVCEESPTEQQEPLTSRTEEPQQKRIRGRYATSKFPLSLNLYLQRINFPSNSDSFV